MARTPLARTLREMIVIAGESHKRNVSVEQVLHERQEKRSRLTDRSPEESADGRELQPPSAAFASERSVRTGEPGAPRIVIVGAGLAGLICAYRLKQAGLTAVVYEASEHPVAGRCSTRYGEFDEGQIAERGGKLIDTGHHAIRRLAGEMGLQLNDLLEAERQGTEPCYFFDGKSYSFAEASRDFKTILNKLNRDLKLAPFPTLYNRYTQRGFELDHMSVADWIDRTVPGGLASRLGRLLDIACNIEYGAESSIQSALNFIYLHDLDSDKDSLSIYGLSDERFHIRGGNEQLVHRLTERLDTAQLFRGTRLIALAEQPDGSYALTFQRGMHIFDVPADKVVLTVPFSVLRTSVDLSRAGFGPLKLKAIREIGMGTNSKLHLQFTDRHWMDLGCNGDTISDTGYQNTFDVCRAQPGTSGLLVNYSGGHIGEGFSTGTAEERARQFLQQLEPVMPGIAAKWNGRVTRDYWPGNPFSLGSYSYLRVGQYTGFAGIEGVREGRKGNCHFAGEHTSIEFQGYMNGAVESGERAAKEIIADMRNA